MDVLIVNGVVLPEPTDMEPDEQDITDSHRNIQGFMKGHVVRHDVHTVVVKWDILSADDYYIIANAIAPKYGLNVFYHLPERNATAALTMYVGDRKKKTFRYKDGKPIYKGVTIKFIEE